MLIFAYCKLLPCKEVVVNHLIGYLCAYALSLLRSEIVCAIVTNQKGRVSLDEDHILFDARKPVIRVCDAVALSHVHAATMRVYTGENVGASQRLQTL